MRSILSAIVAVCVMTSVVTAQPKSEDLVKVDLVSSVKTIEAGKPFDVAVRYQIADQWHLYWLNPGDSGLPPKLKWSLPTGFSASEPKFPVPMKFMGDGDIANFGYSQELVLIVTITPTADPSGEVLLKVMTDYLVCKDICLPGKAEAQLELSTGAAAKNDPEQFAIWMAKLPVETKGRAKITVKKNAGQIEFVNVTLNVDLPQGSKEAEFFPGPSDLVSIMQMKVDESGQLDLTLEPLNKVSKLDETLWGVLAYTDRGGVRRGLELKTRISVETGN